MAYRRRQGITRASTFKEEVHHLPPDDNQNNDSSNSSSSLAAQAIRASAAHRESSLSSAYADSAFASTHQPRPLKVFFFSFFSTIRSVFLFNVEFDLILFLSFSTFKPMNLFDFFCFYLASIFVSGYVFLFPSLPMFSSYDGNDLA